MLVLAKERFGAVFCATGARGFVGEGYPFHKYWQYAGMDWRDTGFSGKTLTLLPRTGNMPLKDDGFTPREFSPRCIWARFTQGGEMFNAVGLSNFGAEFYLSTGMYHRINTPFFISFMPMAEDPSGRVAETIDFCKLLARHLPFNAPFAIQLNVVCPNTGHDVSALQQEMAHLVTVIKVHLPKVPIVLNVNALVPAPALVEAARVADGLWIGNTVPYGATDRIDWSSYGAVSPVRKRLDPKGDRPKDKIDGGLSSPKCLPLTVELVATLRDSGVSIPIVGGNGVRTFEHVADLVSAGCDATFIGSLAVVRPRSMRSVISFANHAFNSRNRGTAR